MWYTIKKFASMFGLTPKALRHYDKIGLLTPSGKSVSGYRLYATEDIERLRRILLLRQVRIPLKQIAEILDSPTDDLVDVLQAQISSLNDDAAQSAHLAGIAEKVLHGLSLADADGTGSGCGSGRVRAAALAIGLQNDFFTGVLRCDRAPYIDVIEPVRDLMSHLRSVKVPIVYICDAHFGEDPIENPIWGKHALIGTPGAEIIPQLQPAKGDTVILKHHYSAFFQTDLLMTLKQNNINTLLLFGVHTHICVRQTAEEGRNLGFRVLVATDCTTAFTQKDHDAALGFLEGAYDIELTTGERIVQESALGNISANSTTTG